jgi:hypothetical protein
MGMTATLRGCLGLSMWKPASGLRQAREASSKGGAADFRPDPTASRPIG